MKKIIFPIIALLPMHFNAQSQTIAFQGDQNMNSGIARNNLMDGKAGYKIEGSPFIYLNYAKAEIVDNSASTFIRYNAMKDEIEVKEGNNVYVLPKENSYGKINVETGEKIRLVNYESGKKSINGYLFLLAENDKIKLYKKEEVILTKEKEAKSAYEESKPSKYQQQKPRFYIELDKGKIIEFPKNKKKLIEIIPDKKDKIAESNANFSKEDDLIRLIKSL